MEQNIEKSILDKYDGIISAAVANLFSQVKNSENFMLKNFDIKNKNHLLALHCAFIIQNQFGKRLYFDARFIQKAKIKRYVKRYNEGVGFIKSINDLYDVYIIDTNEFTEKLENLVKIFIGESASIADIYTAFYERSK